LLFADKSAYFKEKRKIGSALYRELEKNNFPPNYQILCRNCNQSKSNKSVCYHFQKKYL